MGFHDIVFMVIPNGHGHGRLPWTSCCIVRKHVPKKELSCVGWDFNEMERGRGVGDETRDDDLNSLES